MDPFRHQPSLSEVLALAARQHGVVARTQLLELGLAPDAIRHRVRAGRLHQVWRGVYAVGRRELSLRGVWMAAVLRLGPGATLSHRSAAALWGLRAAAAGAVEVSVPVGVSRHAPGIVVHRRSALSPADCTRHEQIPVTTPLCTLIDLASLPGRARLEAAVNQADKLDLIDPEALRSALDVVAPRAGTAALRETLDRRTFRLTDSELERRFLPLARAAGLPPPRTCSHVNGFRVDFHWPELGLVVETDGLRYHRTPAQQARDRLRDQAHTAAGLTPLRFTHAQVAYERRYVCETLSAVARRLRET